MSIDIKVPTVGESITEGTLARWLKKKGDLVQEAEPLFELETDKATGEVPSPASGRLVIQTSEGTTVKVGSVVGHIEESKEAPAKKEPPSEPKESRPAPAEAKDGKASEVKAPPPEKPTPTPAKPKPEPAPPTRPEKPADYSPLTTHYLPPPGERETRKPMSRIRKTISERLVHAQQTAAILTTFNEADMSAIIAVRGQFKDSFKEKHGVGLGFMSFFVKASIEALKSFPVVNARIDGGDIIYNNYFDIGVAVSTERGLMVPVVRDADRLSFPGLEKAIAEFATKAREGKIAVEDLQGGSFTITNGGVFGSLLSTPILNPPQSAILGMHTIQKRPVVVHDQIVARPMMYLALSYDHRLIDGREAVQFLVRVKEVIERPERLLLGM